MIAALGVGWRPAFRRTCSRNAVCMRFHVPSLRQVRKELHTVDQGGNSCGKARALTAGAIHREDGIDHFAYVGRARMPTGLGGRNEWLEDRPFPLTHITGITSSLHLSTSSLFPLSGFSFLFHSSCILPPGTLPCRVAHQALLSALSSLTSLLRPLHTASKSPVRFRASSCSENQKQAASNRKHEYHAQQHLWSSNRHLW
jgi:hypothetical protein